MNTAITDKQAMFGELFGMLLDFANHSFGGKAILAFYTPESLIAFQGKVLSRSQVNDEEYALTFAAVDAVESEDLSSEIIKRPRLSCTKVLTISEETSEIAVVWYQCEEPSTASPIYVATGWECQAGRWLITWMTVAETPANWSFAHGRMMAAGDTGYIDGAGFTTPRTWLDLGWYRVHGHRKPALHILPGARFACHNSTRCCRIGFKISLPEHFQRAIDSIPWEQHAPHLNGTKLPMDPDGQLTLKSADETCRFLDENGHCRIHTIFGRAIFRVCAVYPIAFTDTPDGVDVYGSHTCGSFRDGMGPLLEERHTDLYSRLALTPPDFSNSPYFIDQAEETVGWPRFRALETELVALLMQEDLPLAERLWQGCLIFETETDTPNGSYLPRPPHVANSVLTEWRETLEILTSKLVENFPSPEEGRTAMFPHEVKYLADLLVKFLLSKDVSHSHGLRTGHHVNVLLYHVVCNTFARVAPKEQPLSPAGWWHINALIQHGKLLSHILGKPSILEWIRRKDFASFLLSDRN